MTETQSLPPELASVADFIRTTLPFNVLPEPEIDRIVHEMEIGYFRNGHVFNENTRDQGLRILRSGAAEIRSQDGELLDRLAEGESFALSGLLQQEPGVRAVLIEDSLIYFLPQKAYQDLRGRFRDFDRFFHGQRSRRLFRATQSMVSPDGMLTPVKALMATDLVTTTEDTSVAELADMMSNRRVSSALVLNDGNLSGIVTDRDLRSRVLAARRCPDTPVADIMTANPVSLKHEATLFDATLLMTRHRMHHLPVLEDHKPVGILTTSDLITARQDDPVYIVQRLSRQESVANLQMVLRDIPQFLLRWTDAGVPADQVSHILTAISDTVTNRLIEMALAELGPAPVPYAWLCFGSQARAEQLLNADQDNGLVISDEANDEDMAWFEQLATRVSDSLNECGYVYCDGYVMATNPFWRRRLSGWHVAVDNWVASFSPHHVMEISIAFDLRTVHGDFTLTEKIQSHMLQRVQANSIFQAALAENVLEGSPPIGIFRRFVVERNGDHKDTLNLKKRGLLPIIEIVRLHALAAGIDRINTLERLDELARSKHMTRYDARNLQDALRFLMQVRLQVQADQIREGEELSNYCNPRNLPKLAREQLRDAFQLVDSAQKSVRLAYRQGMR
ncbi:putative nucleotidyltransferase substrate binding domain-containing protein [Salicola sp. Rm-C-2C1-2]|uniref:putative nucleotidyltransferase substrate binding domain-containing protein n=1 Tax=Salicola sp. Rm-C-2C1-2 TaxID=3141321 RepID=UPI0032E3993B